MSDLNNKPVKNIDDMHDKQVEDMLTKGGPGDKSKPGDVNTEEWWKWDNLSDETKRKATKTLLGQPPEDKSILQQAKDKDIWFCTIPFTQVYNDTFVKRYLTALMKRQWGQNLIKFNGVKLPGGIELNGRQLFEDGERELEAIKQKMASEYELPPLDLIG